MSALKKALDHSATVASVAMVVDAKDERAGRFYEAYGFVKFPDHPSRLFLPMKTVKQMF